MASVDDTSSLQAASDEMFELACGPCMTEGNAKEASQYCLDCTEYFFDKCVKYHKKLSVTKTHSFVAAGAVSAGEGRCVTVYCGCGNNKATEFYCEEHADVLCGTCKSFKHHLCQTIPVRQKSYGYTASKLESIIARATVLNDRYDQLKQECSANEKDLKRSKEDCKKEIEFFRKDLDVFLDKLERDMLSDLNQLEIKEHQRIERHMTVITTALQMLDTVCNLLNNARKDGRIEVMFAADIQTSKDMRDFENRCVDLEKVEGNINVLFEKNKMLDGLQREIKKFGSLSTSRNFAMKMKTTECLGGMGLTVRQADDKNSPWVTGCAVMPNGSIAICDRNNHKIKLLDSSLALTESLKLPNPWDISVSDTSNVVITSPASKRLQFIQVYPKLKLDRVIQLERPCWGVHVAAEVLYVTCHGDGKGEVRMFDKQCSFMRRFDVSLSFPNYITVNTAGNKVFVSDVGSHTITCMTTDFSIIYQYKDKDLESLWGIYCNEEDNVLICDCDTSNVHLIRADGKKGGIMFSASNGLSKPCSITYKKSDNVLIVGSRFSDNLHVYSLPSAVSKHGTVSYWRKNVQ